MNFGSKMRDTFLRDLNPLANGDVTHIFPFFKIFKLITCESFTPFNNGFLSFLFFIERLLEHKFTDKLAI